MKRIRPEFAIDKNGWTKWIKPVMRGYLMACCDCRLVHEMQFHVQDNQVVFRARRAEGYTRRERKKMADKADGKQGVRKGSDHGAHAAFKKASSPASVKSTDSGSTKYKHR